MMRKNYYRKLAFMVTVLTILFAYQKYTSREKEPFPDVKFISGSISANLSDFDPNALDKQQWQKLGFSEKQTATILKYKNILGGKFTSKEQLKKCYAISDEKFSELKAFILLPEMTKENKRKEYSQFEKKEITVVRKFNPDDFSANDWLKMGFTERQAEAIFSEKQSITIINYRDRNLRGSFKSPEDLQKCFVISSKKFQEIKPYIKLQEKQQEKTDFSKTDLNNITFRQLIEFGLDERSAGSIIGFRKKLGGFINKQQILSTYNINQELVQKLISIAPLNASDVPKYSLVDAPEDWLKNHPYFKYSADKIIFYRISHPDDKKIWKLLKLKPEYEERMKLYIK